MPGVYIDTQRRGGLYVKEIEEEMMTLADVYVD